jgi:hypothetical protein
MKKSAFEPESMVAVDGDFHPSHQPLNLKTDLSTAGQNTKEPQKKPSGVWLLKNHTNPSLCSLCPLWSILLDSGSSVVLPCHGFPVLVENRNDQNFAGPWQCVDDRIWEPPQLTVAKRMRNGSPSVGKLDNSLDSGFQFLKKIRPQPGDFQIIIPGRFRDLL